MSDAPRRRPGPKPRVRVAPQVTRPRGRPKSADAPIIDWSSVDRSLVHGEAVVIDGGRTRTRRYPSLAELAERWNVTKTRMWQYAHKHKCFERRKEVQAREEVKYDHLITSRRAESRALEAKDVVEVVDEYIRGFRQNISQGKVRTDSPGDLDRMVRLKELMVGNADSRQELQGGLTLEAIQARHRVLRGQVSTLTSQVTGVEGTGLSARSTADRGPAVNAGPDERVEAGEASSVHAGEPRESSGAVSVASSDELAPDASSEDLDGELAPAEDEPVWRAV